MALTAPNSVHEASGPPQATRTLESPTLDARSGFTINHQHPYIRSAFCRSGLAARF